MVTRARDHPQIGFDIPVEDKLAGYRAFDPELFGGFPPQERADPGPHHRGNPIRR
ncbi:hypothetical protein BIWAKO_06077 [Bosea sp. BIWAKO-01]|nr:hypothetical protein BIWAKO_06077 [Bosea sp. BIWAKO-01]